MTASTSMMRSSAQRMGAPGGSNKALTLAINGLGGAAVLGSYAYCLLSYPAQVGDFWGGVPEGLRPVYTANMFFAAAGYLAFTFFLLFRVERPLAASQPFVLRRANLLYAAILVPSALWMPLTFAMLETPSAGLWLLIRAVLATVGIGSVAMLVGLIQVPRGPSPLARRIAIAGCAFFTLQTAVLDSIVWTILFPA